MIKYLFILGEDLEFLIFELRKNTNNIYFIDEFLTISRR